MAFWTSSDIEIKRKSRFLVVLGNGLVLTSVKTCSKPSADIDIKEFQLINHKFKYPGIVTWQNITITLVDKTGSGVDASQTSVSSAMMLERMLKFSGYNIPTRANGPIARSGPSLDLSTPEKASTIANSFGKGLHESADFGLAQVKNSSQTGGTNNQSIKIYHLTPDGKKSTETWILHNPQIKSVKWGDLAYDSDDFIEYTLEVAYDFAELQVDNTVPKIQEFDKAAVQKAGIMSDSKTIEELKEEIEARKALDSLTIDPATLTSNMFGNTSLGERSSGLGSGGPVDPLEVPEITLSQGYSTRDAFDPLRGRDIVRVDLEAQRAEILGLEDNGGKGAAENEE